MNVLESSSEAATGMLPPNEFQPDANTPRLRAMIGDGLANISFLGKLDIRPLSSQSEAIAADISESEQQPGIGMPTMPRSTFRTGAFLTGIGLVGQTAPALAQDTVARYEGQTGLTASLLEDSPQKTSATTFGGELLAKRLASGVFGFEPIATASQEPAPEQSTPEASATPTPAAAPDPTTTTAPPESSSGTTPPETRDTAPTEPSTQTTPKPKTISTIACAKKAVSQRPNKMKMRYEGKGHKHIRMTVGAKNGVPEECEGKIVLEVEPTALFSYPAEGSKRDRFMEVHKLHAFIKRFTEPGPIKESKSVEVRTGWLPVKSTCAPNEAVRKSRMVVYQRAYDKNYGISADNMLAVKPYTPRGRQPKGIPKSQAC